jgi:hypothetical protein
VHALLRSLFSGCASLLLPSLSIYADGEEPQGQESFPANVPQRYANQAVHARRFLLSDFVSIENKERLSYFPKLDVAGSIPVAPFLRDGIACHPGISTERLLFQVERRDVLSN